MVIKGNHIQEPNFKEASLVAGRVRLPPHFVKQAGLTGGQPIDCSLLVVTAGRYRLLKESAVAAAKASLSGILDQSDELAATEDVLENTDSNPEVAMRARLIPCVVSPRGPGWRINVPKEAIHLAPGLDRSRVFLLVVEGFVELWFPETLRRAVSVPLSEVLP
jgi:hypothetical protein